MKKREINNILLAVVVFLSIVPDIGVRFSLLGVTWTAYRAVFLTLFLAVLFWKKYALTFSRSKLNDRWTVFLMFWLLYGAVLAVFSSYSALKASLTELLGLFNALATFILVGMLLQTKEQRVMVIRLIFGVQLALILLGLAEIATGWHMPVSAFHDPASALAKLENRHLATGLMYNANDFSALITCLCAVLPDKSIGKGKYLSLAGVVFINLVNDANICNISLFLLAAFYLFCWRSLSGRPMNKRIIAFSSLLLFAALVIFSGRIRNMVFRVFSEQIGNAQKGTGSLFSRLEIYKDTILAWGRHALLGMGPASFTPYFTAHPSRAGIVNPHGLPLEILFQYGILIFSAFMGLLASLFIRAKRAYDSLKSGALKHILLMNMAFAVLFLINSFVPSSFLGYTYPWMLISVMCIQQDKHAEWEEE